MSETSAKCPECGAELPEGTPASRCPQCLIGLGLEVFGDADDEASATPGTQTPPAGEVASTGVTPFRRFGDYELLEEIARGGMGIVYRARQKSLNRTVAVKVLLASQFAKPEAVRRFHAEAEAIGQLHHPNIVAVHEIGEWEGQPYFSMDYIAGRTLAELVRERPLPAKRAATYMAAVAAAAHYAHQRGILHRDLKPSNVLIDADDQPRVTDFGLAKRLADSQLSTPDPQLTLTGQVLGSPNYLPPEQAAGKHAEVGPPSDVYALGAILYHLLTGRPPFHADSITTLLQQVIETEPVAPRLLNASVPRDLETICLKCLEKEPPRRYPTAQALADDLGRFLRQEPIVARPVGPAGKAWRWCRRQPVRASLIAALVVVFGLGLAGVLWQLRQTQQANVAAERREYADRIALTQTRIAAKQFDRANELLNLPTPEEYRGWEWGWLQRQCNEDVMTLAGAGSMFAVFSPDSRLLATGGFHTNTAMLWDLTTGLRLRSFRGHTKAVGQAAFSPDGRQLATTGWLEPNVRIWDVATGGELRCLPHPAGVYSASYAPDGKRFASACHDGKVRVWDCDHWERPPLESPPYGDELYCVEFSLDGRRVAYGGGYYRSLANSRDTSVCIWDLASGEIRRLDGHTQPVLRATWSTKDDLLASVAFDGEIKLWDPLSARELATFRTSVGRASLMSAAFSPDGRQLVVAGNEFPAMAACLEVFDIPSRRLLYELRGHAKMPGGVSFAPNGKLIASAAMDDIVKVWAAEHPLTFLSLEGHDQTVWAVAFAPNGQYLATGSLDQTARIWDTSSGVLALTLPVNFPVVSLAFSPDSKRLVTVGPDNSACVWRLPSLPDRRSRPAVVLSSKPAIRNPESETGPDLPRPAAGVDQPVRLQGHSNSVVAVAWSLDNHWIATGGKDSQTILWNALTGREHRRLAGHTQSVLALAFSPNTELLASGSQDGTVRLWDLKSGRCQRVLTNLCGAVLSLAFSPDSRLLAVGAEDGTARLWDTRTWHELHALRVSVNGTTGLAFSPEGRRLATAGGGRRLDAGWNRESHIRLWDVVLGGELLVFIAHSNAVYGIAFSPDGRQLATASGDHTARLWTAFPWRAEDYPGNPRSSLAVRVEEYKRRLWRPARQPPSDPARRTVFHPFGDFNLPPAGTKTRPLFPLPPRDPRATADQLDLTTACNVALNESWQPADNAHDVDRSLAVLGAGLQTLAGVRFDVRGMIQLRRAAPECEQFPERAVIPAGRKFHRLHGLHGTRWGVREGLPVAALVLHYADGTQAELPIQYGEHVRQEDAVIEPTDECSHAVVAWTGLQSSRQTIIGGVVMMEKRAAELPLEWKPRLWKATFENPHPEREVRQIEYVSKLSQAAPFLVGLTVE